MWIGIVAIVLLVIAIFVIIFMSVRNTKQFKDLVTQIRAKLPAVPGYEPVA
jgi:flagellar basal body-associated protein FliL